MRAYRKGSVALATPFSFLPRQGFLCVYGDTKRRGRAGAVANGIREVGLRKAQVSIEFRIPVVPGILIYSTIVGCS